MEEAIGEIIRMESREAKSGDVYTVINLRNVEAGFFDWDGDCKVAEVMAGDTVKIKHDGKKYPRVADIEKLAEGLGEETESEEVQIKENNQMPKMCALKSAASLLGTKDVPRAELEKEVTQLAGAFHNWIMR